MFLQNKSGFDLQVCFIAVKTLKLIQQLQTESQVELCFVSQFLILKISYIY